MPKVAAATKSTDAIVLLKADHERVKKLFKEFERLHEDEENERAEAIATDICKELKIHTTLEEEIFYPAVRDAIDDEDLMNEAEVEHASAKDLIAQIEAMPSAEGKCAAKVIVLGEYVNHHIEEEQEEIFPAARKAKVDLKALGEKIAARKEELQAEMGITPEDEEKSGSKTPSKKRAGGQRHSARHVGRGPQ
jgi:hemerythrin-like domain-containing protein